MEKEGDTDKIIDAEVRHRNAENKFSTVFVSLKKIKTMLVKVENAEKNGLDFIASNEDSEEEEEFEDDEEEEPAEASELVEEKKKGPTADDLLASSSKSVENIGSLSEEDVWKNSGDNNLVQISVGQGGIQWGVDKDNKIYRREAGKKEWTTIPGLLNNISCSDDGQVWGVSMKNNIYARVGNDWKQISGSLKNISVGNVDTIWGVNKDDAIFFRAGINGKWQAISGQLKKISAGMDGSVWGINASGKVYKRKGGPSKDGTWKEIDTKHTNNLNQISVGKHGRVYAVNKQGDAFTLENENSAWVKLPGKFKWVDTNNEGLLYGVKTDEKVVESEVNKSSAKDLGTTHEILKLEKIFKAGKLKDEDVWAASKVKTDVIQSSIGKNNTQWGVGKDDKIWRKKAEEKDWKLIGGLLTNISYSDDGEVYGVSKSQSIYRRIKGGWKKLDGK